MTTLQTNRIILFCILLGLTQTTNAAAEWTFAPSIRTGLSYNDNIRMTTVEHDSVWGRSVTPEVDIKAITRLSETRLGASISYIDYTKEEEARDRNRQKYTILSRYQQASRSTWSLRGNLFRDTVLTPVSSGSGDLPAGLDSSAQNTGDTIPDTDRGDEADVRRNRLRLTPSWSRRLTQRSSMGVDYTYYDVSYSGDRGEDTRVDNTTQSAGVSLRRDMTKQTVAGITGRYAEYEAQDVDNKTTNYSFIGILDHDFSKTLSSSFQIGVRKTEAKTAFSKNKSTSTTFKARITQNVFEATSYQLLLERRLLPASSGNVVESDRIDIRLRHRIKPTLLFSLRGRYFNNETIGGDGTTRSDRWYYSIGPGLTKNMTRNWKIDGSYSYRRQKRKTDNRSVDNNTVNLNITYAFILR